MKLLIAFAFIFISTNEDSVYALIKKDALNEGISEEFLDKTFNYNGIKVHPRIKELFEKPYEKKSWAEYRKIFITENRIKSGAEFYSKWSSTLDSVSNSMDMDPFLVLSIIGVETNYGTQKGRYNVFNALYTQIKIMPTKRSKWAKKQLISFLKYCYNDKISPHSIKGSYAGAFGYGQFIPTSFDQYSVDGNNNGKREPYAWIDVFSSIGNYLIKNGYPQSRQKDPKAIYESIYDYNHSDNYVRVILELKNEIKKELKIK